MKKECKGARRSGQAMVMVTMLIGITMATAGVVAGVLTFYELRQMNDSERSAMAFYAADAGVEKTLLCYFNAPGVGELGDLCSFGGGQGNETIYLSDHASATTQLECERVNPETGTRAPVSCSQNDDVIGFSIKSFGSIESTERVLETFYATKRNF